MSDEVRLYLDACCFIDVVKSDASIPLEEGRDTQVWYIKKLLQAHRDRELTIYTSSLTIAEAVHAGVNPVPKTVQQGLDALLMSGQYVHLVQATPFICADARNLRWVDGITLKGADSVHLASAIDRSCVEFLTMDGRFKRLEASKASIGQKGIAILTPSETGSLPGKYLQGDMWNDKPTH